jgi:hypothetical protein
MGVRYFIHTAPLAADSASIKGERRLQVNYLSHEKAKMRSAVLPTF